MSRPIAATYYDGKTSAPHEVRLVVDEGRVLHVAGAGLSLTVPLAEVRVSERIGDAPRTLSLPGGASCETNDNDAVDELVKRGGGASLQRLVHGLERRWAAALAALALLVVIGVAGFTWGIPLLARVVAAQVPDALAFDMGKGTLEILDNTMLDESELEAPVRARLEQAFAELAARRAELPLSLQFRKLGVPNAFALPDGTVLLTDEIVRLAESDDELSAVLAHEIGHIAHRHALRMALESSSTALLLTVYLGDASQLSALFTALPTVYSQARYQQSHETEADTFAIELMREVGLSPALLGTLLEKMQREIGDVEQEGAMQYLSSHPPTSERIRRFEEAAR